MKVTTSPKRRFFSPLRLFGLKDCENRCKMWETQYCEIRQYFRLPRSLFTGPKRAFNVTNTKNFSFKRIPLQPINIYTLIVTAFTASTMYKTLPSLRGQKYCKEILNLDGIQIESKCRKFETTLPKLEDRQPSLFCRSVLKIP